MTQNVPASVKAKLAGAKESGEEFERTLTRFAAERFLFRLGRSPARERCVLKGASLLTVWLADPYRMTRDIDVLAHGATDDGAIRAMLSEQICAVPCPDNGLSYELARTAARTDSRRGGVLGKARGARLPARQCAHQGPGGFWVR